MQTDEHQIFRFNWQVAVIIGITMLALIIPLTGVVICVQHFLNPRVIATPSQPEPPFRKSLEDIANQKLGSSTSLVSEQNSVELQAKDTALEAARIEVLARSLGGFALPAEKNGDPVRLTVQIPGNQIENFRQGCRDPHNIAKPTAPDDARALVEVVIKSSTP